MDNHLLCNTIGGDTYHCRNVKLTHRCRDLLYDPRRHSNILNYPIDLADHITWFVYRRICDLLQEA